MPKAEGFLLVNKPAGFTSYDAIRYVKKMLGNSIKIGHSGTLDPFATGLLIIAIGKKYTRQLSTLMAWSKTYDFEMTFGKETNTLDCEGIVTKTMATDLVTQDALEQLMPEFQGEQNQIPPQFSAKKINGKRAYDYARSGKTVTIEAANVTIHSINLVSFNNETPFTAQISVHCSKGTYVRALTRDIAEKLQTVAYTSTLCRSAIGSYTLEDAIELNALSRESISSVLHYDLSRKT